jgi:hypothetical protein
MTAAQAVGWSMIQTTALTALVSTANIYHGLRPVGTEVPQINYYEGELVRWQGMENQEFTINCRDKTPALAMAISRQVTEIFHGSASTGIYATQNGFDISRAFLDTAVGLLPETEDNLYNAPVIITLIYPSSTVS